MVVVVPAPTSPCLPLQCVCVQLATRPTPLSLLVSWIGLAVDKEPALSSYHVAGRAQPPEGRSELHGCVVYACVRVWCVVWVGGSTDDDDDGRQDGGRASACSPGPAIQSAFQQICMLALSTSP